MTELEAYLKAKHDISNKLQLLLLYIDLDGDKAKALVRQWADELQHEQRFLQLDCRRFVNHVMNIKLNSHHHLKLHVDCQLPSDIDDELIQFFNRGLQQFDEDEPQEIVLAVNHVITFSILNNDSIEDIYFKWQ